MRGSPTGTMARAGAGIPRKNEVDCPPSLQSCFALQASLDICRRGGLPRARRYGEVAEWLNAPHSKCGIRATVSGVRIPPSPPVIRRFGAFEPFGAVFRAKWALPASEPNPENARS